MTTQTKLDFNHRKVPDITDITDIVEMLFPGNRNQQHAAARILLTLKAAKGIVSCLKMLEKQHGISRRTLQRTRAKLARFGLIERITWMNSRYGGRQGWKLSGRMSTGLRRLADRIDRWRSDRRKSRREKDEVLADLLPPQNNL